MKSKFLVGGIFAIVGTPFFWVGVWMAANFDKIRGQIEGNGPDWMMPAVFIGLGALCGIIGVSFICTAYAAGKHARELIRGGNFVLGEIVDFEDDWSMVVNGRPGFIIIVSYVEPGSNREHVFESDSMMRRSPNVCIGDKVKVYYDPKVGYSDYFVEVPK